MYHNIYHISNILKRYPITKNQGIIHYLVLIHQGDGRCDVFYDDGTVDQPIPWDNRCKGSITTSMCDEDVFQSIRSSVIDTDERKIVACYIGSDGVEDSYYDNEETQLGTHRFYMDLSCKLHEIGVEDFRKYLDGFLPEFSRTGSVDDISVAGIVDLEAISGLIDGYKNSIEQYDYKQSLHKRWEETNAKLISMTRKHGLLQQRMIDAEKSLNETTEEKQQLEDKLQQLISKRDRLSKRAEAAKIELEDYRREAQEAKNSVEEKYQVITSAIRLFVDEITAGYSKKETAYSHMLEKTLEYNNQIKELEDLVSQQDRAVEEQKQKLTTAQEEFEQYDKQYNTLSEELNEVQTKINELTSEE